ncbi:MAG: molybdopterin-dependent oxidoreductase [Pyrinomonadaceae bacterium]
MSEENRETEKQSSEPDSEALVEKTHEIETAKGESNNPKDGDEKNTAKILHERLDLSPPMPDDEAKKKMLIRSRRAFLIGGAAALAGVFGWRWMPDETKSALLRRTLEFNEKVAQTFYSPQRLAPEFPESRITEARVNGGIGLDDGFDAAAWRLQVVGLANPQQFPQFANDITYKIAGDTEVSGNALNVKSPSNSQTNIPQSSDLKPPSQPLSGLLLTLDDIKSLPRTEMTTELKCIEGWSIIVHWAGVRFTDFMAKFQPPTKSGDAPDITNRPHDLPLYVAMVTPNQEYYVGLDMPSMLHPQTLLAYEINGEPLPPEHGAPLRMVTPTKYGIKMLKRIGRIEFTNNRPPDYWAEQGYDWYSGH